MEQPRRPAQRPPLLVSPPERPRQHAVRTVLVPERFRGSCPFGAAPAIGGRTLPRGEGQLRRYQPAVRPGDSGSGCSSSWSARSDAVLPSPRQLILAARGRASRRRVSTIRPLARQLGERPDEFTERATDRDPEDPLPAAQQIDDFFRRGALV